jgi:hypothetical protein
MTIFERAKAIADAVLLEGHVFHPYRSSATESRRRWAFGVLSPREHSLVDPKAPCALEAQCIAEGLSPILRGRLRFVRVVRRRVEAQIGTSFQPVDRLEVGGKPHVPWDEGEPREIDFEIPFDAPPLTIPFATPGDCVLEPLKDGPRMVGQLIRERPVLCGAIHVRTERVASRAPDAHPLVRVAVRVENLTPFDPSAGREAVVHASLISTHLLLAASGAKFVSLASPPEYAAEAAAECTNVGTHPVLIDGPDDPSIVLCSPLRLRDHPRVPPEVTSTAPLFPGKRVRVRVGGRNRGTQDALKATLSATVEKVLRDVDGRDCAAVTFDDDPAAELHRWYGRYHYYYADELEPLDESP